MELLQKEIGERPTAERAMKSLGEAVGLSRSTIFRHLRAPNSNSSTNHEVELRGQIQSIALEMRSYGYRPITKELHRRGVNVNHKRVLRLLREDNLLCLRQRAFVRTTDSNHALTVYPNLARGLALSNINQLWVADITYIRLRREFVYLAVVLDAYSRRCIGWALSRHIDTELTLKALRFMRTLKYEEIYLNDYETLAEVLASVQHFIEAVYNRKRLHSAIGYLPPVEFEASLSPPLLS